MGFSPTFAMMIAVVATAAAACSRPTGATASAPADQERSVESQSQKSAQPVADLPFAKGRTFASLDDYLAYREQQGAIDISWYREIGPGVYELVGRRGPGAERKTYTRQELMEKFGFTR